MVQAGSPACLASLLARALARASLSAETLVRILLPATPAMLVKRSAGKICNTALSHHQACRRHKDEDIEQSQDVLAIKDDTARVADSQIVNASAQTCLQVPTGSAAGADVPHCMPWDCQSRLQTQHRNEQSPDLICPVTVHVSPLLHSKACHHMQ